MKIYFLKSKATAEQVSEMLETLGSYIKPAVDIKNGSLAGGGVMHADCEEVIEIRKQVSAVVRGIFE